MKKELEGIIVLILAGMLLLTACAPQTAATQQAATPPDVSGNVTAACNAAALSVFGEPNPKRESRAGSCRVKLTKAIADNGGYWLSPGTTPMEVAKAIAEEWGAANDAVIARILAAMKQQRYVLEDKGLMAKDPNETRENVQEVLDGIVLAPADYPWKGTIQAGGNLTETAHAICEAYLRNEDTCSAGTILWHSTGGDVLISGKMALEYSGSVDSLPVAQPGEIVEFGDQKTIMPLAGITLLRVETEEGEYIAGYSCIRKVTYEDGSVVRARYNSATQQWEAVSQ